MPNNADKEIFLHPGEWAFAAGHVRISTLLGSCVAIVLWHPQLQLGGMCHYLLARRNGQSDTLSGRYGDEAMLLLLRAVLDCGRPLREFHCHLLGGASVLAYPDGDHQHDVSGHNIEQARQMARQLDLQVQTENLGGSCPRMVVLDVQTGEVRVRLSQESELPALTTTRKKA
ncbi:chemotaxis protein CheD [Aquitalea sp. LB_tupeE]|uniref:chemotaxis protein CheD n=1 Tax=Aquitalea sp. LB_tupeE TaxID=2748078 RepID=UPI0015BB2D20|nr:chemotaxis protein CheD [Aquitalea sp. LB_tupeE]NWK77041.1 chemotaxis protein CheD [Aquitalea sp. LB_tupeE]